MLTGASGAAPGRVVLRDAASGRWLEFWGLRDLVRVQTLAEVAPALTAAERTVSKDGLHAAGFVSYEAAPAFDSSIRVPQGSAFPLLWFGLYEQVETVQLEPASEADFKSEWAASVAWEEFRGNLERIKALIRSGDTYQVNYTHRLRTKLAPEPWEMFLQMMAAQEAPYGAFIDVGDWAIGSSSPELFFRLEGNRIECRPMKGTAARGRTPAEDRDRARALQSSDKERAENVMIVDMVRHDLGRVAQTGSVRVASLFDVERYPTLWQMTSTIQAETSAGLGEIFRALFPPASITGAPKVRTTQIIAELEPLPRRVYTGAVGFLLPGRRAQFNVAIRTLLWDRRNGEAEYGVGSGITWDSDPAAEWQECRIKTQVLSAPVPKFSLLETMLWTARQGYVLLERHLERMQESALYFGFKFDLPRVRQQLEQLASTFDRVSHKVRLLSDPSGAIRLESAPLSEAAEAPPRVALARGAVNSADRFLCHKTTHRSIYETARQLCPGFDDVVLFNERGEVTESTIANVAVEIDGQLFTPPVDCGLLPGTLRAQLLSKGELVERPILVDELLRSRRVFLLNSVRGLYAVSVVRDQQA